MLAGSIPFALQISFHSFSANVIDSTRKLQSQMTFRLCTLFLKLGSHYFWEPPVPAEGGSTFQINNDTAAAVKLELQLCSKLEFVSCKETKLQKQNAVKFFSRINDTR